MLQFCLLAEMLKLLYWIGANYYHQVDCQAIVQCLERLYLRSIQPVDPITSQKPIDCEERQHVPTADGENDSAVMMEPALGGATEPEITPEPEWSPSDQMCELAVPSIAERVCVEVEGLVRRLFCIGVTGPTEPYSPTSSSECSYG